MPVLTIGGERSFGENVGNAVRAGAPDVQGVVIPAPYRDASAMAPAAAASSH